MGIIIMMCIITILITIIRGRLKLDFLEDIMEATMVVAMVGIMGDMVIIIVTIVIIVMVMVIMGMGMDIIIKNIVIIMVMAMFTVMDTLHIIIKNEIYCER